VQLTLVLHELATNACKYGALSVPTGRLTIDWRMQMDGQRKLLLEWRESGVPNVSAPDSHGFGTTLIERTLQANGGDAIIGYGEDGIVCEIRLPMADEGQQTAAIQSAASGERDGPGAARRNVRTNLSGKRILLVEDEPLIAMDIAAQLEAAGCEVIGPAGTVAAAKHLIAASSCDAALVDANLAGHPVDEVAAALTQKGIPFAFATGYGQEGLPISFRGSPLLTKPFNPEQLLAAIEGLLDRKQRPADIVSLRTTRP
jgi:CheY-like chemotaxis protein